MFSETKLIDMEASSSEPEHILAEAIETISQANDIDELVSKGREHQTNNPQVYECMKQLILSSGSMCVYDKLSS
ncbi:hypothetical protein DDN60_15535 [Vibrio cholerae]|nr:hypothetical protein [Vibrio cholerae]